MSDTVTPDFSNMPNDQLGRLLILASRLTNEELGIILTMAGTKIKNPIMEFKNREKAGDFEPLNEAEDPENLPLSREPMDDWEFEHAKQNAIKAGAPWKGKAETTAWLVLYEITEGFKPSRIVELAAYAAKLDRMPELARSC